MYITKCACQMWHVFYIFGTELLLSGQNVCQVLWWDTMLEDGFAVILYVWPWDVPADIPPNSSTIYDNARGIVTATIRLFTGGNFLCICLFVLMLKHYNCYRLENKTISIIAYNQSSKSLYFYMLIFWSIENHIDLKTSPQFYKNFCLWFLLFDS